MTAFAKIQIGGARRVGALCLGQTIGSVIGDMAVGPSDQPAPPTFTDNNGNTVQYTSPGTAPVPLTETALLNNEMAIDYTPPDSLPAPLTEGAPVGSSASQFIESVVVTSTHMTQTEQNAFDSSNWGWWNNIYPDEASRVATAGISPSLLKSPTGVYRPYVPSANPNSYNGWNLRGLSDGLGKLVDLRELEAAVVKSINILSKSGPSVAALKIGGYLEHSNLAATATVEGLKTGADIASGKPISDATVNAVGRVGTDTVAATVAGVVFAGVGTLIEPGGGTAVGWELGFAIGGGAADLLGYGDKGGNLVQRLYDGS